MVSRLLSLSSHVTFPKTTSALQKFEKNSPSQHCGILQIFSRNFYQKSYSSALTSARVTKSIPPRIVRIDMEKQNFLKILNLKTDSSHKEVMMGCEEYKEKHLLTFDQYKDENITWVKSDERGSALSKLQRAYDRYVRLCYEDYKAQFFPLPNPLII